MAEWLALHLFTILFGVTAIGALGAAFLLKEEWVRPAGVGTFIACLSYMLRFETTMLELSVVLLLIGILLMVYGLVDSVTSALWPPSTLKSVKRPRTK